MDNLKAVTVYLKTIPLSSDRDALHLAFDLHYYWQGSNYHNVYEGWMETIWTRGRIIDPASVSFLENLSRIIRLHPTPVRIIDTGSVIGWVRGLVAGVSKTPAIALGGCLYRGEAGLKEALQLIETGPYHKDV